MYLLKRLGKLCYTHFMQTVDEVINQQKNPRLLLHACCGPCLAGALSNIARHFDVTVYFFNPNIMPNEEFIRRFEALKVVVEHFGVKLVLPKQDVSQYLELVRGLENQPEGGDRCAKCFELRLRSTAEYFLKTAEFDFFATTLTLSPHKDAKLINSIGEQIERETGAKYLASDFKKHDGFLHSVQLSKELDIYRQRYCGCKFSDNASQND